jgi:hypothetical protein
MSNISTIYHLPPPLNIDAAGSDDYNVGTISSLAFGIAMGLLGLYSLWQNGYYYSGKTPGSSLALAVAVLYRIP